MRDILEAEIASLEELAGQLKGLSEMKPRIADAEYPPKNPESFRRKALEHNRDAIAALTAAHTLKIILAARTKTEQIALMRHYVLEFGQQASRDAKLSKSLADDDPLKAKIDDSVSSSTFVVSTLNGILSDIAPAPAYVSQALRYIQRLRVGSVRCLAGPRSSSRSQHWDYFSYSRSTILIRLVCFL